jgi:hypothetical protein
VTDAKEQNKPTVRTREPKKKTPPGIFDNLRKLPQPHPVEEILGLSEQAPQASEPPTPPTLRTSATPRTARTPRTPPTTIAPERDYAKVANSIVREVVAGGYFTGKSKQLYDFLYSRTRGAIVPTRSVRITKPKLMQGSGIGSERTLLKNIAHLKAIRLLEVFVTDGEHGGNEYQVFLPEEVELPTSRTPPTPPTSVTAQQGHHAQPEVGGVPSVESAVRGVGSSSMESNTSSEPKTLYKTNTERDDDDAALADLYAVLKAVAIEVTGKGLSPAERERWRELGEVLATELKIAAARTTVSSAPSFLTEHLRRRLWKKDKSQLQSEATSISATILKPTFSVEQIAKCPDCGGSGFFYPQGYEGGVAKCKHEKLEAISASEQQSSDQTGDI